MFLCPINLPNSSFVLICDVPSLSFVGPKMFLSTFLSNTINLFFIVSFKTHVSQAYVTVGLLMFQYNFIFNFLETNLLLKRNRLSVMPYFQVLFYFGSLLLLSYHCSQLIQDIYKTGLVLGASR